MPGHVELIRSFNIGERIEIPDNAHVVDEARFLSRMELTCQMSIPDYSHCSDLCGFEVTSITSSERMDMQFLGGRLHLDIEEPLTPKKKKVSGRRGRMTRNGIIR